MKQVSQLDNNGFFICTVEADESPLEPGVYLIPRYAVDAPPPIVPEGKRAKFESGVWTLHDLPRSTPTEAVEPRIPTYAELRAAEYPPLLDLIDGLVKDDQAQVQAYKDACLAVKAKYPKP